MWVILLGLVSGVIAAWFLPVVGLVLLGVAVLAALLFRSGLAVTGVRGLLAHAVHLLAAGAFAWVATQLCLGFTGSRTPAPAAAVVTVLAQDSSHLAALSAADRSAVIAYASGLTYADSDATHHPPDRFHGQWDNNLLDSSGTIGLLQPEAHIHRTWRRDLRWGGGRVQLKITIVPAAGHLGTVVNDGSGILLYPGTTYVWVDSLVMAGGDSGTARALYVPVDSKLPIQRRLLHVLRGYPWNQAVARWTPAQCWDCVRSDWCH